MEIDVFSKDTLKSNQTSQSGLAKQATPVFLTLVWGGVGGGYPPCWFSRNISETVKAVTLAFLQHLVTFH